MPTYLNCPMCPAQAYPTKLLQTVKGLTKDFYYAEYKCPASHYFLIAVPQAITALDTNDSHAVQTER